MGKPAARITDMHICPKKTGKIPHVGGPVIVGSTNVIIGNMPAARVGDMLTCVGPPDKVASGSATVLINGKPAARIGDSTKHGGKIVTGFPTVLIGDSSGGGSGGGGTPSASATTHDSGLSADSSSDVNATGFMPAQASQVQALSSAQKSGMAYTEICG